MTTNAKTTEFENNLLNYLFRGVALPNIGATLYISLHQGALTDASDQTTNEVDLAPGLISPYARQPVVRNTGNWDVPASGATENAVAIAWAAVASGSASVTWFGIGTDLTGTGHLLYYGELTTPLAVSAGITPQFAINDLDVAEL